MRLAIGYLALLALLTVPLPAPSARAAEKPLVGKPAPAFSLPGLDGKPLSPGVPKGTVVLLNFWDFGCPSCNQEVKHLERLQQKYGKQGFRVIGVAGVEADAPKVKQFLRQHEATYPVALDPRQTVAKKYGVTEHPATVIIDRQGVVRFVHTGFLKGDEKTLEAAVRATLEGGKLAMTE